MTVGSIGRAHASALVMAAVAALTCTAPARATMTLTAAGTANNFHLDSVVTGLPEACCAGGFYGPLGTAVNAAGKLVINDAPAGKNFVFNNVNGQSFGAQVAEGAWADGNYGSGLATLGGVTYGTHYSDNTTRIVNADGSEGAVIANIGRGGLAADAARHSLLAATDLGLVEIDLTNPNPATNYRYVAGPGSWSIDGVTASPDGSIAYVEQNASIIGYRIADGTVTYNSGYIGSPDGVGVISGGALNGDLVANFNDGTLHLLNPADPSFNLVIASGGSRGDYVGFDPNGSLFVTQSDAVLRLSLSGGAIGGGGAPEPASWAMMLLGLGGAGAALRRRRVVRGHIGLHWTLPGAV